MIAQVEIAQQPDFTWTLSVDGEDLSSAVSSARLLIEGAGKPAHVTLELVDLTRFLGMAEVVIDPVLYGALLKLGWMNTQGHCPACHDAINWPECAHEYCQACGLEPNSEGMKP